MATWNSAAFMDEMSPFMTESSKFHDYTLSIFLMILIFMSYNLCMSMNLNFLNRHLLKDHKLELIWTCIPAILILFIMFPSLFLLYSSEEVTKSSINLKVTAHQWYWSYEYPELSHLSMNCYIDTNSIYRLLETKTYPSIPVNTQVTLLITSMDVIHSWTLPSMAIKMDAVPGRLNMVHLTSRLVGTFYGQCSEICGTLHSFMPIKLEVTSSNSFYKMT